jgi:molybdopterin converting factor small subunit
VKVEVHLTATLRVYLPAGTVGDNVVLDVPDGATVDQVVHSLRIPRELERLTVVNGRDAVPDQALAEGDVLSLFPPLAGG